MLKKQKILIIEDENSIGTGLVDVFTFHGFEVSWVQDGKEGLDLALKESFELIILDVMLPKVSGFEICGAIREKIQKEDGPFIIMLTAKSGEEDIINGLSLGADDYISKPFSVQELVLRVKAVLRRSSGSKKLQEKFTVGPYTFDPLNLEAETKENKIIRLTRKELEIICYLKENPERPISRGELLEEVWGYKKASKIETRTVDIHIAKIRRKIEVNPKSPELLTTVRGEGYKLAKDI